MKAKIDTLENSRPTIVGEIDRLKTKRASFMKELEATNAALSEEENKLEQLPTSIVELKENNKALCLHKQVKSIQGPVDEDQKIIANVDQMRLRAIQALHDLLDLS